MDFHPYAAIWPLMTGERFEEFATDIAANGLQLPIVTYQGKILDGRNRYRACTEAGVEPRFEMAPAASDAAALDLVVSLNLHRRQLSVAERSFAAARLATMKSGTRTDLLSNERRSAGERDPSVPGHQKSVREAAHLLNVSPGSVARARAVLKEPNAADLEAAIVAKKTALHVVAEAVLKKKSAATKTAPPTAAPKKGAPPKLNMLQIAQQQASLSQQSLTREQVDPEFVGDALAFGAEYGHVCLETAEQRATSRFGFWAMALRYLAKEWSKPEIIPPKVDLNWLRSPKPDDVTKLRDALDVLKPVLAAAEAALAKAEAELAKKPE